MWPVYEFRPLRSYLTGDVRRYADGSWLPDDGEYDLAFAIDGFCLMIAPPYQKNIQWKWLTGHWTGSCLTHPNGNPWHYMLCDGENSWGGAWDREMHPNVIAGRKGMNLICGERRAASGLHVEFDLSDKHIAAELVRERDSKQILSFPERPVCMYCGDDSGADAAIARARGVPS